MLGSEEVLEPISQLLFLEVWDCEDEDEEDEEDVFDRREDFRLGFLGL